jgi:tRNA/rRNA methyltransferase
LLNKNQFERLQVVLVSPRNPLNIGAAARAMANFGVTELRVVTPFEGAWREAKSAVEAEGILEAAREFASLAEALGDATLVLGTGTSTYRRPDQPHYFLPAAGQVVAEEFARAGRVALVFGSEKHGLAREELSLCHAIVEIPTDPGQPSMNLGQAVAVCLYALSVGAYDHPSGAKAPNQQATQMPGMNPRPTARKAPGAKAPNSVEHSYGPAEAVPFHNATPEQKPTVEDLERLTERILEVAQLAEYSPAKMEEANRSDLRLLLRRWQLTPVDVRRAMGLFRRIEWRLRKKTGEKHGEV